jgi:lysophospholipase L1-like esterase
MTDTKPGAVTIVAFGDSITLAGEQPIEQRWTTLVEKRLTRDLPDREVRVVNAGVGGNTSREGLVRMEKDVLQYKPDIVTVQFGGNDATPERERHVPIEEYSANLNTMRETLNEAGARVVLVTFPPIIDAWHAWRDDEAFKDRGGPNASIDLYRNATRTFARTHRLPLADLNAALCKAIAAEGAERFIMPDGVHLTAGGNEVAADENHRVLEDLLSAMK